MGRKSRNQEILDFAFQYKAETGAEAIDLDALASWAITTGHYKRPPKSMHQRAKEDISRALRSARHQDPQGRTVRSMHPVPLGVVGEQQPIDFAWVDMRTAEPLQMRAALSYRRNMIYSDVRRHRDDTDSYNDNNLYNAQIPIFDYDFNKDLAEAALPSDYDEDVLSADFEAELEALK